jgi:uncharacterized protein
MPLADSNIWLSLALSEHELHVVVRGWFASLQPPETLLFCRPTQQSFLRLLTTREVLALHGVPPLTNEKAWSTYEGFLADDRVAWVEEPRGLEAKWKSLATKQQPAPKLWNDAYLAAFAIAGGHRLVTTDKGFKQFAGLDLLLLQL